jgi:dihydroflavonol-4-reductase
MKAFVTGATGFVGAHVVRALLGAGVAVRALAREGSDRSNLEGLDIEIVSGDLRDEAALPGLLRGCETLYHVAAFYSTRPEDGALMHEINVRGTKNLMMAALASGVQRVVHTSTIGTIGRPAKAGELPTEETAFNLWETSSEYVRSKYLGEVAALSMVDQGLPVVVVHPTSPVGPYDIKPTSSGQRIIDYLNGKKPSFPGGGLNFVSVEDVAAGHLLAAEKGKPGERYILGNAQANLTLERFMGLMAALSGVRPPEVPDVPLFSQLKKRLLFGAHELQGQRPAALICDPSKAIRELGLPQTPIEAALVEAIFWFRDRGYVKGGGT